MSETCQKLVQNLCEVATVGHENCSHITCVCTDVQCCMICTVGLKVLQPLGLAIILIMTRNFNLWMKYCTIFQNMNYMFRFKSKIISRNHDQACDWNNERNVFFKKCFCLLIFQFAFPRLFWSPRLIIFQYFWNPQFILILTVGLANEIHCSKYTHKFGSTNLTIHLCTFGTDTVPLKRV